MVADPPCDESGSLETVDPFRDGPGGHHGVRGQFTGHAFERMSRAAEGGENVELALSQPVTGIHLHDRIGQVHSDPVQSSDDALGPYVDVGPFTRPFLLDAGDMVGLSGRLIFRHTTIIASAETILVSMEAISKPRTTDRSGIWALVTAVAPIAWGTTYFVTRQYLPEGYPLYGALIRALPAGILLLLIVRRRPHGSWWWKSVVLGILNMGAFFVLVYLAAQLLPTSIASTVMAAAPVVMMLFAWAILGARPRAAQVLAAGVGILGVALLLLAGTRTIDAAGVTASIAALAMSSLGYVLAQKWSADIDAVSLTAWQLVAAGLVLAPVAVAVEGAPPAMDVTTWFAYAYISIVGTAIAFVAWFTGLRHLGAGTVGLVGLLNPVTGVLLGTLVAGELLTVRQILGVLIVLAAVLLGQPVTTRALVRARAWMRA